MKNLFDLPQGLRRPRGIHLIRTKDRANTIHAQLIASLLLDGPLFVINGSDWFPAFELTCFLQRNMSDAKHVLNCLYTAQASTCHELFDALANRRSSGEAILILDFLHTFYDSEIPLSIRILRLSQSCRELQRLAFYRPITVTTTDIDVNNSNEFTSMLASVAERTFSLESELELRKQIALF